LKEKEEEATWFWPVSS